MKNLIIILGPTGIGKTNLSISLAKQLKTEILSCDSRQLYKEMNIGTAVPSKDELLSIRHHFIQTHSIHNYYNVSLFENQAIEKLSELFIKHNEVIMTGGSMLYIDAICKGIDIMPDSDIQIRAKLKQTLAEQGLSTLAAQLKELDPNYYKQVDLKNPKRVLHGVEMCLTLGYPYSEARTNPQKKRQFNIIKIGLDMDRSKLYDKINERVDMMISEGLLDEAKELYKYSDLNALNTVGYKEVFAYFKGEHSLEKSIELIKRNTRHYAKKQLTWFRKDTDIKWFEPHEYHKIYSYIEARININ